MFDIILKCQCQVDLVNSKLSRFSCITYKLNSRMNLFTAKNLYIWCVKSCIKQSLVVWGGASLFSHRCDKMFELKTHIVKNLFSRYFHVSDCFFKCARILKLSDMYRFFVLLYIYRILKCDVYS